MSIWPTSKIKVDGHYILSKCLCSRACRIFGAALRSFPTTLRTFWMFIRSSSFDKIRWKLDASFGIIVDEIDGSNILCTGNVCSIRVPLTGRKMKKAGVQLQVIERKPWVFSNKVTQFCRSIVFWGREFWFAPSSPITIQWSLQVSGWLDSIQSLCKGLPL